VKGESATQLRERVMRRIEESRAELGIRCE